MTKLIVRPIDPDEKGSFRQRSEIFDAISLLEDAGVKKDAFALARAFRAVERMALSRLRTDDGSDPAELLRDLSANQFDTLLKGLLGEGETVGEASAAS